MSLTHSYNTSDSNSGSGKSIFQAVVKNILIILTLCLTVKLLSMVGADKFCEELFQKLAQDESLISKIVGFELGYSDTMDIPFVNSILPQSSMSTHTSGSRESSAISSSMSLVAEAAPPVGISSQEQIVTGGSPIDLPGITQLLKAGAYGEIQDLSGLGIDFTKYTADGISLSADFSETTVLIIHTHGSEAYKSDGNDVYIPSDPSRTENKNYNMIRVGNELAAVLEAKGVKVIHDTELYDYPSYNGSYTRSLEAIVSYLEQDPGINVVIDLHRDSASDGENPYKTTTTINGETTSQVMIIAGTNSTGLWHPNWEENLKFALLLQGSMNIKYPSLARPLYVTQNRYNQHATMGSLIVEVGYNGNTLKEALGGVKYFGDCMGDVINLLSDETGN